MSAIARSILNPLASLRLTVPLLAAAMLLVFFGTLAQKNMGLHAVLKSYFHTFVIWAPGGAPGGGGGWLPLPGGYLIGGLLLANLLTAHLLRFKIGWKRTGVILIHSGVEQQ